MHAITVQKQLLAGAITLAMSLPPVAGAAVYTDVSENYWADRYIEYLSGRNIISGYPDNTFRPAQPVTRAEFAVMLAHAQGLTTDPTSTRPFSDVPAGHWASGAIQSVAQRGWIAGYPGGRFAPNQPITMAEMYTVVSQVAGEPDLPSDQVGDVLSRFEDAGQVPGWARASVAKAAHLGIYVSEVTPTELDPTTRASRASVAATLAKLLNRPYRDGVDVAVGEQVDITGELQPTPQPNEWAVVTNEGRRYILESTGNYPANVWFRQGAEVRLRGRIDEDISTTSRTVVSVSDLMPTQPYENRIAVTGTLYPSTEASGAWVVRTPAGETYQLINSESYEDEDWFGYGAQVELTGNVRSDVTVPEGTAVVVSDLDVATRRQATTISGVLRETDREGGWLVETTGGDRYVLLDAENYLDESWFQTGTEVDIEGVVRTDIPTVYGDYPVLRVSEIAADPDSIAGTANVRLFFPHTVNREAEEFLDRYTAGLFDIRLLDRPVTRIIEGPNLLTKSVEALLEGPTAAEEQAGYFQIDELDLLSVEDVDVQGATANVVLKAPTADFRFENDAEVKARLNEQVSRTLMQFQGIQDVDLRIEAPNDQVIWTN